jgi:NAD(P)-dependent dehydrogenase (short-subunit alcohol dehydrogenase family)
MREGIQRENNWQERRKRMIIFGGSGGLGVKVAALMHSYYEVEAVSSAMVDISSFVHVDAFIRKRQPDIVLNFAGVNHNSMIHKIDHTTIPVITEQLTVNLQGAINIAAAVLPGMREREYGRLIMISSVLSIKDVIGTAVYSATKAGIDRLVRSISAENISKRITANSIQLGYFDGGLTYKLPDAESVKQSLPLKRFGKISELISTIDFFINTEYATGINLPLTGGCF